MRPDGVVLEAPTSAIFWASGEELRTPSLASGILDSITRRAVVERLDVVEGELRLDDALAASEAFLASTTREIQPVSEVDGRRLDDAPGPQTDEAANALTRALDAELEAEWTSS